MLALSINKKAYIYEPYNKRQGMWLKLKELIAKSITKT